MDKTLYKEVMLVKEGASNQDMSFVIGVDGRERIGKSVLASQLACAIDPSIIGDLDRVAFTVKQFKEASDKARSLGKGKVVVLDEAGNIFGADDSQKRVAKQIKKIIMMNGKYNIVYILCVPSIFDLSPYIRIHRLDWFLRVKRSVVHNVDGSMKFERGYWEGYSYDQKIKLLFMARHKYDYSASNPMFRGRFFAKVKTEDVYGKGYEHKKDEAIRSVYDDKDSVNEINMVLKRLIEFRGEKITNETIEKAFKISKKTIYDRLKKTENLEKI